MGLRRPLQATPQDFLVQGSAQPTTGQVLTWGLEGSEFQDPGNAGLWTPAQNKLLAATFDPRMNTTQGGCVAGKPLLVKMVVGVAGTIGKLWVNVQATGTLTANNFLAICDASGNVLGTTADQTTAWGSTGPLSAAVTVNSGQSLFVTVGQVLYGLFLFNGSGSPTFSGAGRTAGMTNVGLAAADGFQAWTSVLTGQTAVPSAVTPSTGTAAPIVPWFGISV